MEYNLLFSYALLSILLGLIPGPSVLFTAAFCMKYGLKPAIFSILGQLSVNLFFLTIVFFGINNLPVGVFNFVKTIGSFYIIYLGIKIIINSNQDLSQVSVENSANYLKSYFQGFIICLANPKVIIHLGVILPQFISPGGDKGFQLLLLCIISIVTATIVLLIYTLIPLISVKSISKDRSKNLIKYSGVLMILAGFILFFK